MLIKPVLGIRKITKFRSLSLRLVRFGRVVSVWRTRAAHPIPTPARFVPRLGAQCACMRLSVDGQRGRAASAVRMCVCASRPPLHSLGTKTKRRLCAPLQTNRMPLGERMFCAGRAEPQPRCSRAVATSPRRARAARLHVGAYVQPLRLPCTRSYLRRDNAPRPRSVWLGRLVALGNGEPCLRNCCRRSRPDR